MAILLDSWTWIEYWSGGPLGAEAAVHIDGVEEAFVSAVNVAEVYRWFLSHYSDAEADEALQTMRTRCTIIPLSDGLAVEAARVKHERGWGLADAIVLATAQSVGATVVTGDTDFEGEPAATFLG